MKSSVHINSLNRACIRSRARGFTLLEVMVALVITSIGLLGIAKIQALAYASTGSSSLRSLVALQVGGLAASMHANRNYWAAGLTAPLTITVNPGNAALTTISDATLNTPANCLFGAGTPCTAPTMAAFDLQSYAQALNAFSMLRNLNPVTTITCPVPANPVSCTIQVTWNEHAVSLSTQSATSTTQATFLPTYTLYVEP
jgi:type IV pilus assembly protein PilV